MNDDITTDTTPDETAFNGLNRRHLLQAAGALIAAGALSSGLLGATSAGAATPTRGLPVSPAPHHPNRPRAKTMTYQNPILGGFAPDPSIVRAVGGGFFLANSSFSMDPGIPVHFSTDLVHWTPVSYAAAKVDVEPGRATAAVGWGQDGLWAPTIREHNGTYYMIVTNFSQFSVLLTSSPNPKVADSWSPAITVTGGGFDPDLFFDDDGSVWLMTATSKASKIDLTTGTIGTSVNLWGGIASGGEGPHLYRIGKYYYLSLAEGGTATNHMQTIARLPVSIGLHNSTPAQWETPPIWLGTPSAAALNPTVVAAAQAAGHISNGTPPYNPILNNGSTGVITQTGHADLVKDWHGNWWTVFLATRPQVLPNLGRETYLAPVTWVDGWPVVNGGKPITLKMTGPDPDPKGHKECAPAARDDFKSKTLGLEWNRVYTAHDDAVSLTTRPGYLTLLTKGAIDPGGDTASGISGRSALVGRRQRDKEMTFTTLLEFAPRNDGERAGIMIFGTGPGAVGPSGLTEFVVRRVAGKNQLWLNKRTASTTPQEITAPLGSATKVWLRAESRHQSYTFSYSLNGRTWKTLDKTPSLSVITFPAYGGIYTGLWATSGTAKVDTNTPAYFDWAEYNPA